jgi:hypothetical protein
MPKRNFLYLFMGAIVGIGLTLGAVTIFKQATKKPVVISPPRVQAPSVSSAPAPKLEEQPAPKLEEQPAPKLEEQPTAPIITPEVKPEVPTPVKEKIGFKPEFQKGMTYIAWTVYGYSHPQAIKAMEQLVSLGVQWAAVVPTWYQEKADTPKIYPLKDKTTADESLISAIRKLHDLKLKVMLKPHLDLIKGEGKWRADIGFGNDADWKTWFENYTNFILHYAQIAAEENVELFCIGTELSNATVNHPAFWRELIKKVRESYPGALTYAANWYGEFDKIEFWGELDYAGVDPYFPLVCSLRPTVEDLRGPWQDWLKNLEAWQKEINKPVIFPEIGYKSAVGSTDEPWQHMPMGELDLQLQANCYQALLETFWNKPWFYGAYWWYWGVHPKMGGEKDRGFTPQNKPAQEVIKEYYTRKPVSGKEY